MTARAGLAAAAAGAALLAGCGGAGAGKDAGVDGARETTKALMARLADADGDACELMTGDAQRQLAGTFRSATCADAVKSIAGQLGEDEKRALKSVTVPTVQLSGTTARVADSQLAPRQGSLGSGWDGSTALGYVDGRWLVTDLS